MTIDKKKSRPVIFFLALLIFVLIYGLFIRPNYHLINRGTIYLEAIGSGELDTLKGSQITTMSDGYYIATSEGLTKYTFDQKSVWNKSYHLNELLFLVEAPYMAVVNITGKEAYIFDSDGSIATIKTNYNIVSGSLNEVGFLALVLEEDNKHFINMYDYQGRMVVERRTIFNEDGFPISVAVAKDASRMMTSHLDVTQHVIESIITFLDFSGKGEEFTDRVVGHERLNGTLAARISFLDNDHAVVIGDNLLSFYYIDPLPELIKSIPLDVEIEDVDALNEQLIIKFGEAINPDGEDLSQKVMVFSKKGEIDNELTFEDKVTNLSTQGEALFVIQGSRVMKYIGKRKVWETNLHKDVINIHELSNNRYLIEYEYDFEILKLKDI